MVALKNMLLAAVSITAATSKVIRRDAAQIQSDLMDINGDVVSLTDATNSYSGGLFGAIPVQNAESNLEDSIQSATSNAQASGPVSSSDSQDIIDYINNTLEPNIDSAVTAIINKMSQFQSAGLAGTVRTDLDNLKSETDDLGAALVNKAASDKKTQANAALDAIDADFQRAIAAYN
ncbi:hypothetical protein D0869_09133 [Hortaea werneckii]|uniref:Hydrophobic surface binding protein n=1 Tax=Hortaea werneckii TaxID=91943 RepID=A0A3M6WIN4_HORWE|nr:hypothetical protein KC334_g4448 [Hortaea werneckii]KAI7015235.1 hypothetical protein KC355_g4384 [Hortaea werneckii]KAI7140356.1 hypothetical protein KC324_g16228 [Hortaea werneckii]KAI7327259.1 hypothetical protein KC315_g7232 [Hortaea werneckii]KAI7350634.1 hypothetical protein KC354_g12750 [Hortaea werneckii]